MYVMDIFQMASTTIWAQSECNVRSVNIRDLNRLAMCIFLTLKWHILWQLIDIKIRRKDEKGRIPLRDSIYNAPRCVYSAGIKWNALKGSEYL